MHVVYVLPWQICSELQASHCIHCTCNKFERINSDMGDTIALLCRSVLAWRLRTSLQTEHGLKSIFMIMQERKMKRKLMVNDSDSAAQESNDMTDKAVQRQHQAGRARLDSEVAIQAALQGKLSALQKMYAADHRAERLADFLKSSNAQLCTAAASRGHLHILRWAMENELPWDESTFQAAFDASEHHPDYSMRHR